MYSSFCFSFCYHDTITNYSIQQYFKSCDGEVTNGEVSDGEVTDGEVMQNGLWRSLKVPKGPERSGTGPQTSPKVGQTVHPR